MMYAADTSVPIERSRAEIERLLTKYGASRYMSGWDERGAAIMFEAHKRRVRFVLPMPDRGDFGRTPAGQARHNKAAQEKAYEQDCRRRWRALCLVIKAKLEAVETGITTFEDEFLAHIVLPNGGTIGKWIGAQIEQVYTSGAMPPMLGTGSGA